MIRFFFTDILSFDILVYNALQQEAWSSQPVLCLSVSCLLLTWHDARRLLLETEYTDNTGKRIVSENDHSKKESSVELEKISAGIWGGSISVWLDKSRRQICSFALKKVCTQSLYFRSVFVEASLRARWMELILMGGSLSQSAVTCCHPSNHRIMHYGM